MTTSKIESSTPSSRSLRRRASDFVTRSPVRTALGLVILVLAFGTVMYSLIEGWNLLDSLYFCVITLTTIGYGDFSPTTQFGRLVTIFYAFAGLAIFATYLQLRSNMMLQRRIDKDRKTEAEKKADSSSGDA